MELIFRPAAEQQLSDIVLYVRDVFGETVARKTYHTIMSAIMRLPQNPRVGRREPLDEDAEVRILVIKLTLVYYLVLGDTIIILAIVDQRMSPRRIIRLVRGQLKN